jgi:hypothetical protein
VLFFGCGSSASVTLATMHRYTSISGLLEPVPSILKGRNFKIIAVNLQVILPFLSVLSISLWDPRSDAANRYNIEVCFFSFFRNIEALKAYCSFVL